MWRQTFPLTATSQPAGRHSMMNQIDGNLVTIVFDDNERLVVARQLPPANARSGDVVTVRLPELPGSRHQHLVCG